MWCTAMCRLMSSSGSPVACWCSRVMQAKVIQQQLPPDMKAGWLEKRSGDSSSLNALPVDSWKWQKRW